MRVETERPIRALLVFGLILGTLLACGDAGMDGARQRLLAVTAEDPIERVLATPARMSVVYWPAIGTCRPEEMAIITALDDLRERYADLRLLTVLPMTWDDEKRYGISLPGEIVRLADHEYLRQAALAPLPRVEVWGAEGELLLAKSLPAYGDQSSLLVESIEASRALTAPLEEGIETDVAKASL